MRWDFLIFLSISLANLLFADDFVQAPFEVAAASPNLGIANPNALNFGPSDATFGTDWAALDSSLVNDRVIVAGGAQQQNLPQRKKDDNLSPTWIRKVPPGRGAPKPSNPIIPEGAWGRYPGYPNENTKLDDTSWIQTHVKGCGSNGNRSCIAMKDLRFFAADLSSYYAILVSWYQPLHSSLHTSHQAMMTPSNLVAKAKN